MIGAAVPKAIADVQKYNFQVLNSTGDAVGDCYLLNWREVRIRVAFAASRYSLTDLEHMRALAHAGRPNPVDLVLWTPDKQRIEWSARIWLA